MAGPEPAKTIEKIQELQNTKDFKTIEDLVGEVIFMVTGDE